MSGSMEIERLYDAHAAALLAFLLNLTRNEADTRDLLQEIFVKLARDVTVLGGLRAERAFLIRLAHKAAIGWNEKDDGGVVVYKTGSAPEVDHDQGDWVWRYPQTE